MKGKVFYDHLIIMEEIIAVVGNDKKALALVDEILHQEILDVIFSYLPKEHHAEFFGRFHAYPGDTSLMTYLQERTSINIELAILDRSNKTKRKLLTQIKRG